VTRRVRRAVRRQQAGNAGRGEKVQRLIDLIAALLAHHLPATFAQLVEDVPGYRGKTPAAQRRMFERDKLELRAFGVPLETIGEEGSDDAAYRIRNTAFYLPYLAVVTPRGLTAARRVDKYGYRSIPEITFEVDELAAIAAAVAAVQRLGDPVLAADAGSAMQKLAFDLSDPPLVPPQGEEVLARGPRADPEVLRLLGEALLARKRVTFDYDSMSGGERSRRTVEPYGLFFLNGHWYLAARDPKRDAVRNFRVSRIGTVAVNERRALTPDYEIPEAFDLRAHARSRQAWELGDGDPVEAIVEFPGRTGAARAAAELGSPIPGSPRRRSFAVRRVDVFARWLLALAGEAIPIAPPKAVAEYRRLVAETRALYTDGRRRR
jgi:predicted DNA-binding transcriptional regulator YafY